MVWINENKQILYKTRGQYVNSTVLYLYWYTFYLYQKWRTKKEVKKYGADDTEIPTLNNIYSSTWRQEEGGIVYTYLKTYKQQRKDKKDLQYHERDLIIS